jgi:hypothetical protein
MNRPGTLEIAVIVVGVMSAPSAALADDPAATVSMHTTDLPFDTTATPDATCADRPWYCGIPEEQQTQSRNLFDEGNKLFDDALMVQAVALYREALTHWDHPAVHYNLMLALSALDRPIEAYESSVAALRYGEAALRPNEHRRAEDYRKILRGRVAELEVSCDEPGAIVTLDGQEVFRGSGRVRRLVLPGPHEVAARKPGYLTTHQAFILKSDRPLEIELRMLPRDEAVVPTQRWQSWKPWAMAGTGAGLALMGGAFQWRASAVNRAFARQVAESCMPNGCAVFSDELRAPYRRYVWHQRMARGAYAVGAVAALTGLALAYINRPTYVENPARRNLVHMTAAPHVGPSSAGLSVNIEF